MIICQRTTKTNSCQADLVLQIHVRKKDESDAWLASEKIWTKLKSNDIGTGWREEYRCNKVPYRCEEQCAAAFYFIYNAENEKVTRYDTGLDHTHDDILARITVQGINSATKKSIQLQLNLGIVLPKVISNNLEKEAATNNKIKVPEERQLYNHLQRLRNKGMKIFIKV